MRTESPQQLRRGVTFLELVVSTIASSFLLAGLTSSLFIALESIDPDNTPAVRLNSGLAVLTDMAIEVQSATAITEQNINSITFMVADRDGDSFSETIRYTETGQMLIREYNSGGEFALLDNIHSFNVSYYQPGSNIEAVNLKIKLNTEVSSTIETTVPLLNQP